MGGSLFSEVQVEEYIWGIPGGMPRPYRGTLPRGHTRTHARARLKILPSQRPRNVGKI